MESPNTTPSLNEIHIKVIDLENKGKNQVGGKMQVVNNNNNDNSETITTVYQNVEKIPSDPSPTNSSNSPPSSTSDKENAQPIFDKNRFDSLKCKFENMQSVNNYNYNNEHNKKNTSNYYQICHDNNLEFKIF